MQSDMRYIKKKQVFSCYLEPNTLSDICVPSRFSKQVPISPLTLPYHECYEEGKGKTINLAPSVRCPWQNEVYDLPTGACLLSGRTEVRTPETWVPAQEPSRNHQRQEELKIRLSTHLSVDSKYGSNGGQAVDVGRSI